jgi:signal transduction histidine kinase
LLSVWGVPPLVVRKRRLPSPDDAIHRRRRHVARVRREYLVRVVVTVALLAFVEALDVGPERGDPIIRLAVALSLLLDIPFYLLARADRTARVAAHAQMFVDITLVTVLLGGVGGLAAAPYLIVYALMPVYAGVMLSAAACLAGTLFASGTFLGMAWLQELRWLPSTGPALPGAWTLVWFNLLVLNVVGGLTAMLTDVYRRSRERLGTLYQELERAHDEALALNTELQRRTRLHVLGEVTAGIAHEMRNAMSVAAGQLDVALLKIESGRPILHHLQHARGGCESAIRVLGSTLAMARQSGEMEQAVSLPETARQVIDLKRYDLRRDGIEIELEMPEGYPPAVGVPFQLQQVLLNLITNAQEALRETDRASRAIRVVGRVEPGHAVLDVQDTGPGIAPEILSRLFDRFVTTKRGGTGLGLAISAGLLRQWDAELTAGNRPEGGAVFRMRLRRADVAAAPEPSAAEAPVLAEPVAAGDARTAGAVVFQSRPSAAGTRSATA